MASPPLPSIADEVDKYERRQKFKQLANKYWTRTEWAHNLLDAPYVPGKNVKASVAVMITVEDAKDEAAIQRYKTVIENDIEGYSRWKFESPHKAGVVVKYDVDRFDMVLMRYTLRAYVYCNTEAKIKPRDLQGNLIRSREPETTTEVHEFNKDFIGA